MWFCILFILIVCGANALFLDYVYFHRLLFLLFKEKEKGMLPLLPPPLVGIGGDGSKSSKSMGVGVPSSENLVQICHRRRVSRRSSYCFNDHASTSGLALLHQSEAKRTGRNTWILVCDHENIDRAVIDLMIKDHCDTHDWILTFVHTGEDLLKQLEIPTHLPDVILMDIHLPGMSGIAAALEVRKSYTSSVLPIIIVTSYANEGAIVDAFDAGANDYIVKPLRRMELIARINTQLALKHSLYMALEAAYDIKLLHDILPDDIIHSLRTVQGEESISKYHEHVTVLFSDIVGFTTLSSQWKTEQIIAMLNDMFSRFDRLCDIFGVFKVETIGDAYMVVAGLQEKNTEENNNKSHEHEHRDSADVMLAFAQAMLEEVNRMETRDLSGNPIQIRVGIHSGSAHSGVVGLTRPRYCFFGDTVNTASRMESNGFPMCIHVSQAYLESLTPALQRTFVSCGIKHIKGKGDMETFVLRDLYGAWRKMELLNFNSYSPSLQAHAHAHTHSHVPLCHAESLEALSDEDTAQLLRLAPRTPIYTLNDTGRVRVSRECNLLQKALSVSPSTFSFSTGRIENNVIDTVDCILRNRAPKSDEPLLLHQD